MKGRTFSEAQERAYYSRHWPVTAPPYGHLERYLRCWLDPEQMFRGQRVLDIGAGECGYTRLISERFEPADVVACDLFAERMRPAASVNVNRRVHFVAGNCSRLPFRDEAFTVVFGSLVLHQLPDLERVVAEIRRVLGRAGRYIGIEPSPYHPLHLYRYARGHRSPNQYLLTTKDLSVFARLGFVVTTRYFYAKLPWLRGPFLTTCFGVMAVLDPVTAATRM